MKTLYKTLALCSAIASTQAFAGTETWFTPLTESAPVTAPNSTEELTQPWVSPTDIVQYNLVSLREVEDAVLGANQSIVRVPGAGNVASMFDMIAYDPSGSYLFIPHETPVGAGVTRHNIQTRTSEVLFSGDLDGANGNWANDYGAFDPCRFTPNGTLFLGEEWTAEGRIIEVLNPFDDVANIQIRELDSIANVSHEGINFSEQDDKVIYYVDEWNSGSIYKFVMTTAGDYTTGQTFVLSVDDFISTGGVASDNWNEQGANVSRTGPATWIPLTDANGTPLVGITDPFRNGPTNDPRTNSDTRGARPAADDVDATPYGRPEDAEVGVLANGNEVLYFAATSERTIYAVEITGSTTATVGVFASDAGTPKNLGFPATTAEMNSPDNLAQDALGNIYIIEDAPNGSSTGGDIWFCRDVDGDGVAESVDHFLSIRADGSEATGMIFNPANPAEFVVAVQHPDSTDLGAVTDGIGDAVWAFDISEISNQLFVQFLDYATEYPSFKNQLAAYFNSLN